MTASSNGTHPRASVNGEAKPRMNSTSSVSFAEADMRNLGLEARSSSPAKRTRSEREEEDLQTTTENTQLDGTMRGPRSPTKIPSPHTSPMPSRLKAVHVSDSASAATNDTIMEENDATHVASTASVETSDDSVGFRRGQPPSNTSTSVSSPPTSVDNGDADKASPPSYDEQVDRIDAIIDQELSEGLEGYLVPKKWSARLRSRTTKGLNEPFPKPAREGDVGLVDLSGLASLSTLKDEAGNHFVPLKPGVRYPEDFEVFPKKAWNLIMRWHGKAHASPVITRYAHDTSPPDADVPNFQWELNPPICTIQKVRSEPGGSGLDSLRDRELEAVQTVASRTEPFSNFIIRIKRLLGINESAKIRVWKMIVALPTNVGRSAMPTPMSSRDPSPAPNGNTAAVPDLLVEPSTLMAMTEGTQRELLSNEDSALDKLHSFGFADSQTLVFEEQIRTPSGSNEFITDELKKSSGRTDTTGTSAKTDQLVVQNAAKPKANSGSARRSPTPSGLMTRGRTTKKGKSKGATGLQNLGNTCYMNSALQCIRSIEELSIYFLTEQYKADINMDNPLGHHGQIAKVYSGLLSAMYENVGSFSPRNFKATIGKVQPLFSGYGQQDSQEFLSFLIDALHEDLNRVKKKPYIENPESDDKIVHDPEAIKGLGETFRSNFRARNDSVAMDLFNGFYKNTMVCPQCDKVSITFDPYSALTVQLPIESTWQFKVIFAPIRGNPIYINVDIDKNSTMRGVKQYIAKRVPGVNPSNLVMAEEYSSKFYKVFEDAEVVSEANIQANDNIVFYELDEEPTNWPPLDKKRSKASHSLNLYSISSKETLPGMDSPRADRMAIPVLNRLSNGTRSEFKQYPSFILVNREEAKDYDLILRKILQKVETMTTRSILDDQSDFKTESSSQSRANEVSMSEEDGTSEETKVQAHSVEGEDGLVDVSMTNSDTESDEITGLLKRTANSKILDPSFFINASLRNMFDIKIYCGGSGELIPTGFSSLSDRENYPTLESRMPQPVEQKSSSESWDSNSNESSEDELQRNVAFSNPEDHFNPQSRSRTASMSSHEDDAQLKPKSRPGYTQKKFDQAADDQAVQDGDDNYLLRLGEGLLLDWNTENFEALFGKSDAQDLYRGQNVLNLISTLPDPALEERKAKRLSRKKNGVTLDECFNETSKSEVLSEENAWYCNRCKELRRATKTLEIWTVPDILVVHLKRFGSNSRMRDKMDVFVDFPLEGLDLTGRVGLPEGKSLIYDCFAVDNHYGGLGGGHYTANAKNFFDKRWYNYNDTFVSPCDPKEAVSKAAYLLFYRRRTESALGPPYLRNIVEEAWAPGSRSTSPSGEDQRRDGSLSPNGSSSGSRAAAAEAIHLPASSGRVLGSAGAVLDPTDQPKITMGERDLDEGISMDNDNDPDNPIPSYEDSTGANPYTNWSWAALGSGTNAPPGSDNDSTRANDDNVSDDGGLMEENMDRAGPFWNLNRWDNWQEDEAMDVAEGMNTSQAETEDEVAEVRVEGDDGP